MQQQMSLFEATPRWTVGELTRRLRRLFETDESLQNIWVQGEISNFSRPASGHLYFTLKDSSAQLRCVMWKNDAARLQFRLEDGLAVEAHGGVSIYEAGGQYQLYVDLLKPSGEGALYQEFLRRKALLEAEGLFDPARKRPLPEPIRRIGIVTSPTGAALQDMLNTLGRRLPLVEVLVAPSPVQGENAPQALVEALRRLSDPRRVDVILLARGGGSIEDLWAFNDPAVVRAVAASPVPVITGIGHETDFTLADFAANLRAPTPTAAAELATPVTRADMLEALRRAEGDLAVFMDRLLTEKREGLSLSGSRLGYFSPARRLQTEMQRLDEWARRTDQAFGHRLAIARARLDGLDRRLEALSPLAVLERGYAVVTHAEQVVASTTQVAPGDALRVRVRDGEFDARVTGEK
jgi:exodeoxyribonuclease VII large subunit